jgi:hypothetical protein
MFHLGESTKLTCVAIQTSCEVESNLGANFPLENVHADTL